MSTRRIGPPFRNPPPARVEPDWHRYEQLKAEWKSAHPGASCAEYDAAIRAIAEECHV